MSLHGSALVYVFLETHRLAEQRAFLEQQVGLPVIEVDGNRRNRHGVVKYDAGGVVLSLNLAPGRRFDRDTSDGLTMVFAGGHRLRTDLHGHHYLLGDGRQAVTQLRLRVADLPRSAAFYRDVLGLPEHRRTEDSVELSTGSVPIVLERHPLAPDGRPVRYDTYLLVFHTPDIHAARAALTARGLAFSGRNVGSAPIGSTARFTDPSGHRFCLYEPSKEVLAWPSGPKVRQLILGGS
jgi:catechol 2,3-dioxygenase-like lactoylglutathione lyase family enzyme